MHLVFLRMEAELYSFTPGGKNMAGPFTDHKISPNIRKFLVIQANSEDDQGPVYIVEGYGYCCVEKLKVKRGSIYIYNSS